MLSPVASTPAVSGAGIHGVCVLRPRLRRRGVVVPGPAIRRLCLPLPLLVGSLVPPHQQWRRRRLRVCMCVLMGLRPVVRLRLRLHRCPSAVRPGLRLSLRLRLCLALQRMRLRLRSSAVRPGLRLRLRPRLCLALQRMRLRLRSSAVRRGLHLQPVVWRLQWSRRPRLCSSAVRLGLRPHPAVWHVQWRPGHLWRGLRRLRPQLRLWLVSQVALLPLRKQRPHTCRCRMALLYTRKCPGSW